MRLDRYSSKNFDRGASRIIDAVWLAANAILLASWLPGSGWRVLLLRAFGADLGQGVIIKPGVRVKFPWRLRIGDHSWIGEKVWIDNLAEVRIGSNVCISQEAYFCTGSHDWSASTFDLVTHPIFIQDKAWVAARASVGPGVTIGEGAVLGLASNATKNLSAWSINLGSPALETGRRNVRTDISNAGREWDDI